MSNPSPNESNHIEATDHAVAAGGDIVDSTIVTGDVTAAEGSAVAIGKGASARVVNQRIINITSSITIVVTALVAIVAFMLDYPWRWVSHVSVVLMCLALGVWLWRLGKMKLLVRVAMLLVLVIGMVSWLGYAVPPDYWRTQGIYAPTATPNELLVVLAEFEATGTKKYDATGRIRTRLEEELKKSNITNARFVLAPKVSSHDEARALGKRHQAVFVIWGHYDDAGFRANFTIIRESKERLAKTELKEVGTEQREFNQYIREGLPAQMAYFATFTMGQLFYWDKKYDEALRAFDVSVTNIEQARRIENIPLPDGLSSLYFYRGKIYQVTKGNLDQAITDYNKVIELDSKYTKAYNNRGVVYDEKGNLDQAIADFTKTIELDPTLAQPYINRGVAYGKKGNLDQAIADFTKTIELDPTLAQPYTNRGVAYDKKGNLDQAITDYNRALDLDPKNVAAYINRGVAYGKKGNLDQAITDYNRALDLDPKFALIYYNRGSVYSDKGDLDQAINDYTKAIELDSKFADTYANRGFAYRRKGLKIEAIADFETYLYLDPNASNRTQVEQWLRELKGQ